MQYVNARADAGHRQDVLCYAGDIHILWNAQFDGLGTRTTDPVFVPDDASYRQGRSRLFLAQRSGPAFYAGLARARRKPQARLRVLSNRWLQPLEIPLRYYIPSHSGAKAVEPGRPVERVSAPRLILFNPA